jgi:hypothetical protein
MMDACDTCFRGDRAQRAVSKRVRSRASCIYPKGIRDHLRLSSHPTSHPKVLTRMAAP